MSIQYLCDGCDQPVAVPMEAGHITKRHYCDECKVKADTFLEAEQALRKRLVEQFVDDRALLIAKFSEGNFKLPDVA